MKNEFILDWQIQLTNDEWLNFITYSHQDEECNDIWKLYRSKKIDYEELNKYEFELYKKFKELQVF